MGKWVRGSLDQGTWNEVWVLIWRVSETMAGNVTVCMEQRFPQVYEDLRRPGSCSREWVLGSGSPLSSGGHWGTSVPAAFLQSVGVGQLSSENLSCRGGATFSWVRCSGGFRSVHALTRCALPSFCPDRGRGLPWWHGGSWACSPVSSQQSRAFCSFHFGES